MSFLNFLLDAHVSTIMTQQANDESHLTARYSGVTTIDGAWQACTSAKRATNGVKIVRRGNGRILCSIERTYNTMDEVHSPTR